jgi:2-oxo-4-hydroxy-4-carboxy-5-ureidoimidazoline decarboxylase
MHVTHESNETPINHEEVDGSSFLPRTSSLHVAEPSTPTYRMAESNPSVIELLSRPDEDVIAFLGPIYEHSSWVAEILVAQVGTQRQRGDAGAIETVSALAAKMKSIVNESSADQKLALLRAHPDLCEKVSKLKDLTAESQTEQGRAGLQSMTEEEMSTFQANNTLYRQRFGFPFILAVRNATKSTVLAALQGRVNRSYQDEFATALEQVHKIAWMRLLSKLDLSACQGFLSRPRHGQRVSRCVRSREFSHFIDRVESACPSHFSSSLFANATAASSMRIQLHRLSPPESAGLVGDFVTNSDGRLSTGPALKGADMIVGTYEWTFCVADYFASVGTFTSGTPFLDTVPLRFGIDNPDDHYHVPLLVSPWSYSTYRGS